MNKLKYMFAGTLLFTVLLAGCSQSSPAEENGHDKLTIYTTIFPIEDFTKEIGGEYVDVSSIYPAGADPHTYEPSIKSMMKIADADLFIFNGAGLESFVDKITSTLNGEEVEMVEASSGIELAGVTDEDEHVEHEHEHGHSHDQDPHIWLDPTRADKMAKNIQDALIEEMPEHQDVFEENYNEIHNKLVRLDDDLQSTIEDGQRKEILVAHAAYGYWEERYGIKQISISGLSAENEPSQRQLQNIIETAKKHHLHYIIYSQNPATKVVSVIQKETDTEPLVLHNLEYITEDDKKADEGYFSLMERNISNLEKALTD